MTVDRNKFPPVGGEMTEANWPEKGKPLDVGDSIAGKYIAKNENVGKNKSNVYVLETEDGTKVGVWGSTVLDARFDSIEIGQNVAIEFQGEKVGKTGSTYKDFYVGAEPKESAELPF